MKTFDKFRNCITEPRCRDCEGIPGVCEEEHQSVSIPKALALDVLELLKEQKNGHWVQLENCANEGVYCSECHTKIFELHRMKKKSAQYCGHCGAKMESEE